MVALLRCPWLGGVLGKNMQKAAMRKPSKAAMRKASVMPAFWAASTTSSVPSGVCCIRSHCAMAMPAKIQPTVPHSRTWPKSRSRSGR